MFYMGFDDIPEDLEPAYPCPECDGSVTFNNESKSWECSKCYFKRNDKNIFSEIKNSKICDHCGKGIGEKDPCYTIKVIKGTGEDNERGEITSSIFCEKCYAE